MYFPSPKMCATRAKWAKSSKKIVTLLCKSLAKARQLNELIYAPNHPKLMNVPLLIQLWGLLTRIKMKSINKTD